MTNYSAAQMAALARSMNTTPSPGECEPRLKTVPDTVWTRADGYAAVDARSGGRCECAGAGKPGCGRAAEIHHHIAGRVGVDPHNPGNLLHLRAACHDRIHANPLTSYAEGTMRKRLGDTT